MSKHKNKKANVKVVGFYSERELFQTIIIAIVLVLGLFAIFLATINFSKISEMKELGFQQPKDIWEESFREMEEIKVGIQFNNAVTTEHEYFLLRQACNEFLFNLDSKKDLDKSVITDLQTTEDEFVDTNNIVVSSIQSKVEHESFTETGPIYFDNMLLLRYINDSGDLAIISALFTDNNKSEESIKLYKQSELTDAYNVMKSMESTGKDEKDNNKESKTEDTVDDTIENIESKSVISEENYINDIANNISSLIIAKGEPLADAIQEAIKYFTYEGKNTVNMARGELKLDENAELNFKFGIAGRSNSSKVNKDRIYLYYEVDGDVRETLNIVVKLNKNLRIFDIDIV